MEHWDIIDIMKLHVFTSYYNEINAQVAVSDTVESLTAYNCTGQYGIATFRNWTLWVYSHCIY
jgi:hypothetical protein